MNIFHHDILDPDCPSRQDPKFRECLHWLKTNIQGDDCSKRDVLVKYLGSGPPQGTRLHRYIFIVYEQPGKISFDEKHIETYDLNGRLSFSLRKFAAKYNLGNPIAGNMYQSQFDDYVPEMHAKLKNMPEL